ncbi:MAG: hypothetical protein AAGF67_11530, partial [Verrucomicrobiota bacterium]
MKPLCLLLALFAPFLALPASAEESGQQALTYSQYPYRFGSDNPLKPKSPILLQFSQAVDPDAIPRHFQLYDKTNDRFAAILAKAPSEEEIRKLKRDEGKLPPLDTFVVIEPSVDLPLGGSWYLNGRAGMKSLDGTHEIVEGKLNFVGSLQPFAIDEVETSNEYDSDRYIRIRHNKRHLSSEFTAEKLGDFVSVSPVPNDFAIEIGQYRILLKGDFQFGIEYRVSVKDGLFAYDTTRLDQSFVGITKFTPNEGFIAFPAFTTTQNASGHRRFDVKTGNLTGLRTRVKKLDGKDLILAIREYDDKYEGWGEKQSVDFSTVPGSTVYDQFRGSTAGIDKSETVSMNWSDLTEGAQTGSFYLCSEGKSATRESRRIGAQSIIQLTD